MASESETKTVSLKMLVDTKANKVLFAEAGKEFVDFIFHIMSLPLGTVLKLLNDQESSMGCLGDLYKSVESLSAQYFQSIQNKDSILNPKTTVNVPLLSLKDSSSANKYYYRCSTGWGSCVYVTDRFGTKCPTCGNQLSTEMKYYDGSVNAASSSTGSSSTEGYVKGLVTYMVMDNLEVKPMSTISGIALINKFHVKDISCLEEKDVQIGLNEGLAILKAALETKAVFSTVFFGQKVKRSPSMVDNIGSL